jgi:hypothetical protein
VAPGSHGAEFFDLLVDPCTLLLVAFDCSVD